jgi:hypothetical protein
MQDRFDTPRKLASVLDNIPVTIIVIDDQIPLKLIDHTLACLYSASGRFA